MDRFVALIGGKQNLPPKIDDTDEVRNQPSPAQESQQADDSMDDLPSVEAVIAQNEAYQQAARVQRAHLKQHIPHVGTLSSTISNLINTNLDTPVGNPAPRGVTFTPFGAVTKFCYKFVPKQYSQPLATAFFDSNKIYNRPWDLYYIHSEYYPTQKPTIYVPGSQLQALLDEINEAFPEANIQIGEDLRNEGLIQDFDGFPDELRPRWLGHSESREQHDAWIYDPPITPRAANMPQNRSLEAFKAMIDAANDLAKAKSKSKKKASHQYAILDSQAMGKMLTRAQRQLGLRKKSQQDSSLDQGMASLDLAHLDLGQAAPFCFEDDVIIIAVDVEAYERSPKIITEVGVATLDTRDLRNTSPGELGKNWHQHIRARHFRVVEHKHLCNHEFVAGCPEAFEFGKSEFVAKDKLASTLTACFHEPFSSPQPPARSDEEEQEKRNIIVLGHDIGQDIQYLHSIGFSVLNRGNLLETMDTATLFKSFAHDVNITSLGQILYHFDLTGWHLHNAGNDAVYTVHAMLAICVQAAMQEHGNDGAEVEARRDRVDAVQMDAAVESVRERRRDEEDGWVQRASEDGVDAIAPKGADFQSKKVKDGNELPVHGPARPPVPETGLYTMGGVPLDV